MDQAAPVGHSQTAAGHQRPLEEGAAAEVLMTRADGLHGLPRVLLSWRQVSQLADSSSASWETCRHDYGANQRLKRNSAQLTRAQMASSTRGSAFLSEVRCSTNFLRSAGLGLRVSTDRN